MKSKLLSISIWKERHRERFGWSLYHGSEIVHGGTLTRLTLTIQAALAALEKHGRKRQ